MTMAWSRDIEHLLFCARAQAPARPRFAGRVSIKTSGAGLNRGSSHAGRAASISDRFCFATVDREQPLLEERRSDGVKEKNEYGRGAEGTGCRRIGRAAWRERGGRSEEIAGGGGE